MKNYRMLSEEKTHFVLHDSRDNRQFKVAKSGLSDTHMSKIRKLADGGEVDGGDDSAEDSGIPETTPTNTAALFNALPNSPPPAPLTINPEQSANFATPEALDALKAKLPKGTPETQETQQAPETNVNTTGDATPGLQNASYSGPQASPTAAALSDLTADNEKIMKSQVDAINSSASAAAAASQAQAKVYDDQARQMAALQKTSQDKYAALDQEQEQLKQDVANTKIDPNRVWNSTSTGNKILAAVGVLLSGIGSGASGGPNLALQVIHKTIDDDIAAQRAELGKKQNLLSVNYRKYGDLQAATAATALQLNSVAQGQVAALAARANSAQAQAAASQAIGQLQLNANQLKQQLAVQGLKSDILNGGAAAPGALTPSLAENLFPGRVVNTPMGVKIAKTPEEAKETSKALTSLQTIDKRLDDMLSFSKQTGTTYNPLGTAAAVGKSLKNEVIQELGELNGLQRLTGEEVELRKDQVPDPGAYNTDKAIAQVMALKKFVKEKMTAEYANHLSGFRPPAETSRDYASGAQLTNYRKP